MSSSGALDRLLDESDGGYDEAAEEELGGGCRVFSGQLAGEFPRGQASAVVHAHAKVFPPLWTPTFP